MTSHILWIMYRVIEFFLTILMYVLNILQSTMKPLGNMQFKNYDLFYY